MEKHSLSLSWGADLGDTRSGGKIGRFKKSKKNKKKQKKQKNIQKTYAPLLQPSVDYHAVCQIFSRYCKLFFDGSPQVKCSQLSCCCRCSQFVKFSHCTQRVVSSQVLIFAHLTQRLVSSQFLIFLIWLSVWEAQGFSCFLILSHFFSFYLIFSHFISFFLILSHLFSFVLMRCSIV